jgi:hypothetical protein
VPLLHLLCLLLVPLFLLLVSRRIRLLPGELLMLPVLLLLQFLPVLSLPGG